ncbi:hypothetical protein OsI_04062 [Oryza sativa Indica Group]|uniref:Uncharacterized protein n=1 Tax=Oryza sativa subsp. indica TaxID=39946 RepID=B8AAU3_ORYSI|nr:hypothetical protein OsI_04062 [Oryza sativa Indica Group]
MRRPISTAAWQWRQPDMGDAEAVRSYGRSRLIPTWKKIRQPNPNPKIISPIPFLFLAKSNGGGGDSGGVMVAATIPAKRQRFQQAATVNDIYGHYAEL